MGRRRGRRGAEEVDTQKVKDPTPKKQGWGTHVSIARSEGEEGEACELRFIVYHGTLVRIEAHRGERAEIYCGARADGRADGETVVEGVEGVCGVSRFDVGGFVGRDRVAFV